jgi:hypothetical protein
MKFILILMLYHFNGDKIARTEYIPVPGVWTKNECYYGGANWIKRGNGRQFECLQMDALSPSITQP